MDKQKIVRWVLGISISILGIVMLTTSSIYLHGIKKIEDVGGNTIPTKGDDINASSSIALSAIGCILIIASIGVFIWQKEFTKITYTSMSIALILFIISFSIVGTNLNDAYKAYKNTPNQIISKIPTWWVNMMRLFPVNLSFILLMGLPFIGASVFYIKDEFLL